MLFVRHCGLLVALTARSGQVFLRCLRNAGGSDALVMVIPDERGQGMSAKSNESSKRQMADPGLTAKPTEGGVAKCGDTGSNREAKPGGPKNAPNNSDSADGRPG